MSVTVDFKILKASMCSVGSASVWKPLCYTIPSALRADRSETQVAECLSENSKPLDAQISESPPHKLNVRHQNGPKKKTTETRGWNPVSKSLNKQGLWKWIAVKIRLWSRECRKTSGPDYTTRWQQDVSSPLFVSASSVLLYLLFSYALRLSQHHSVFFSFSPSLSVSASSALLADVSAHPSALSASSGSFNMEVIREEY